MRPAWYKRKLVWLLGAIVVVLIAIPATSHPLPTPPVAPVQAPQGGFDPQKAYNAVADGMSRPAAEKAIGKQANSCSTSAVDGLGEISVCSYYKDFSGQSLTVSYTNGKVTGKNINQM